MIDVARCSSTFACFTSSHRYRWWLHDVPSFYGIKKFTPFFSLTIFSWCRNGFTFVVHYRLLDHYSNAFSNECDAFGGFHLLPSFRHWDFRRAHFRFAIGDERMAHRTMYQGHETGYKHKLNTQWIHNSALTTTFPIFKSLSIFRDFWRPFAYY